MSKSESSRHRVPPYKRPLVVGGFLFILSAAIIITVLICKSFLQSNSEHVNNPSNNSSTDQPVDTPPDIAPAAPDDLENKAPQFESESPNDLPELTGRIIYADIDPINQVLHSAVMIDQYLQADGQCIYNVKRGEAVYRTASAVATGNATTSYCGAFDISIADLPSGNYQLEVIITGDGKRGVVTDDLEI